MIVLLGTGGTIAAESERPQDGLKYKAAVVGIQSLLANLPSDAARDVECEQVLQLDSKDMDFAAWRILASRVDHHLRREEVAGIVVTHGTDTMEETAYFLHRLLSPRKPVVITGAMRPPGTLLADGPQNLLDALAVVQQPGGLGVTVVMNGTIFHPVGLRKGHAHHLNAFSAGEAGPVGVVESGQARTFRAWPQCQAIGVNLLRLPAEAWPRVEILMNAVNATGEAVQLLAGQQVDGLVVAGTGNGSVSTRMSAALEAAEATGVAIRLSTRCAGGRLVGSTWKHRTYPHDVSAAQARVELTLELLAVRSNASDFSSHP